MVLVGEVLKLFVAGYFTITDKAASGIQYSYWVFVILMFFTLESTLLPIDAVGVGFGKLIWLIMNAKKIVVLVFLYSASNILSYYALARVEAAAYTVLLQVFCYYFFTRFRQVKMLSLLCFVISREILVENIFYGNICGDSSESKYF